MLTMYTLWKPGVDGSGAGGGGAQWCMHPKCYNLRSKA